jgi:hypothetical protein
MTKSPAKTGGIYQATRLGEENGLLGYPAGDSVQQGFQQPAII